MIAAMPATAQTDESITGIRRSGKWTVGSLAQIRQCEGSFVFKPIHGAILYLRQPRLLTVQSKAYESERHSGMIPNTIVPL